MYNAVFTVYQWCVNSLLETNPYIYHLSPACCSMVRSATDHRRSLCKSERQFASVLPYADFSNRLPYEQSPRDQCVICACDVYLVIVSMSHCNWINNSTQNTFRWIGSDRSKTWGNSPLWYRGDNLYLAISNKLAMLKYGDKKSNIFRHNMLFVYVKNLDR